MSSLSMARPAAHLGLGLASAVLGFLACSSSTQPPRTDPASGDIGSFSADVDPQEGSFVLQRITTSSSGAPGLPIELIGRSLVIDEASDTVTLEVAVHNASEIALHAPAFVWLGRFSSASAWVLNADVEPAGGDSTGEVRDLPWGFDYSTLLGDDGRLDPDETSGYKLWAFHSTDLAPFSFQARAEFAAPPERPSISGAVFLDENESGVFDDGETLVRGGVVFMTGPEGETSRVEVEAGRYRIPVESPGLYTLRYARRGGDGELCFTTPNPLSVVLPPGDDGGPTGYDGADFGVIRCGPGGPGDARPVVLIEDWPPDAPSASYRIVRAALEGDRLFVRIVYTGCGAEPADLYVSTRFAESFPVQTRGTLAVEPSDCLAEVEETHVFDLGPLRDAYAAMYGEPGKIVIHLAGPEGDTFDILFGP